MIGIGHDLNSSKAIDPQKGKNLLLLFTNDVIGGQQCYVVTSEVRRRTLADDKYRRSQVPEILADSEGATNLAGII